MIDAAGLSLTGPKPRNEDNLLIPHVSGARWVAAIADGVGGNVGGAEASKIAIQVSTSLYERPDTALEDVFAEVSEQIYRESIINPDLTRMATTLSLIRATESRIELAHVGDTRVYHVRGSGIVTRTEDQTEVAELIRQKVLTPSQAKSYPRRNVLTSFLSASKRYDLFRSSFEAQFGDWIFLLSDGAYKKSRKNILSLVLLRQHRRLNL
jgi:serine/threonine protein phosphatase PrpC